MSTIKRPRKKQNGIGAGVGQPGGVRRNRNSAPCDRGSKGVGKGTKREKK